MNSLTRKHIRGIPLMRGSLPQRDQLKIKLLREQPHLRVNTAAFREMFVLRAIYVAGIDSSVLANYTGYNKQYVSKVMMTHRSQALKAYKQHIQGFDYEPTVIESVKNLGRTVGRFFEKKQLQRGFNKLKNQFRGAMLRRAH